MYHLNEKKTFKVISFLVNSVWKRIQSKPCSDVNMVRPPKKPISSMANKPKATDSPMIILKIKMVCFK